MAGRQEKAKIVLSALEPVAKFRAWIGSVGFLDVVKQNWLQCEQSPASHNRISYLDIQTGSALSYILLLPQAFLTQGK